MCISSGLQDKIDPASWIGRKQGWAGITNPANIVDTRVEGLMGIGDGKTETEKRAARDQPAQLGIAGRRNVS